MSQPAQEVVSDSSVPVRSRGKAPDLSQKKTLVGAAKLFQLLGSAATRGQGADVHDHNDRGSGCGCHTLPATPVIPHLAVLAALFVAFLSRKLLREH